MLKRGGVRLRKLIESRVNATRSKPTPSTVFCVDNPNPMNPTMMDMKKSLNLTYLSAVNNNYNVSS